MAEIMCRMHVTNSKCTLVTFRSPSMRACGLWLSMRACGLWLSMRACGLWLTTMNCASVRARKKAATRAAAAVSSEQSTCSRALASFSHALLYECPRTSAYQPAK